MSLAAADSGGRAFLARHARASFWYLVALVAGIGVYTVWDQYQLWEAGGLSKLLLPEYQGNYFYFYALTRILAPYLLSFIFALVLLWVLPWINKRSGGRFFEAEEPYMAASAVFLVGYPGWLFYIPLLIGLYLFWHLIGLVRGESNRRLPLYGFWGPTGAVLFLTAQYYLASTPIWLLLKI
ncbi:MAG: hypothetical protein WD883_03100 [Candidatus Colwellbacteria bacterium]